MTFEDEDNLRLCTQIITTGKEIIRKSGRDYEFKPVAARYEKKAPSRWVPSEQDYGEGSNTYTCSGCGFVLQLMEGTPKENEYHFCPFCGREMENDV